MELNDDTASAAPSLTPRTTSTAAASSSSRRSRGSCSSGCRGRRYSRSGGDWRNGQMEPRMNYDPDKHHRRSIRLKSYDYRQSGAYFVTIVAQDRACLFGDVVNEKTRLNDAGGIIEHWWFELNHKFPTVETDEFVVMPNHFHGIIVIVDVTVGADLGVGPDSEGAHTTHQGAHIGAPLRVSGLTPAPARIRPFGRGAPVCAPSESGPTRGTGPTHRSAPTGTSAMTTMP